MTTGFGIVGTGMISRFHAKAIKDIPTAKLVGCSDMKPERAASFGAEEGCKGYESLEAMLADPAVQVVTICTPSGAHVEPAVAAAKAGKHVLVEKPLEITLERCDKIINACKENNVLLGAILPSRFSPANIALKEAIDSGRFGKLTLGDTYVKWWRTQEYYDSGAWRGTWELDGGGSYMNQAIHNVDLLYWFMGEVDQVCGLTSTIAHERIAVEDVGSAIVKFKNGAIGTLEATTSAWPGLLKKTEIHGTQGSVIVEQDDVLMWEFANALPEDVTIKEQFAKKAGTTGGASDPKAIAYTGHKLQFEDFVEAIQKGRAPKIDGLQGRKSVELILAIYESAWTGKRVQLPLKADPERPA
ncbi:MAG TPA: Gfo/Idh/MocA family oxidoreductase [Caulifigura sp.]|jgi:predicted dehydrogenase|nr:Gfo/Idh/MocA family oxidoreductase [Caulifigura sp.]